MKYVIYKIVNCLNNWCYIGCSKNKEVRFKEHIRDLTKGRHHNIHLQRAWNKYGRESFEFIIFEEFDSEQLMFQREKELINSTQNIYNIAEGGLGGNMIKFLSEEKYQELCKKKRVIAIKVYSEKFIDNNPFNNISQDRREELLKIWSECKRGIKNNNAKYFSKVIQISKNGEEIIWDNLDSVPPQFNRRNVRDCCNKKAKTHKGFAWKFCEG